VAFESYVIILIVMCYEYPMMLLVMMEGVKYEEYDNAMHQPLMKYLYDDDNFSYYLLSQVCHG
jgi:hypothetical protein